MTMCRVIVTKWCLVILMLSIYVHLGWTLTGDNVCTEHQKYNVTKRIKYRAPIAVKTYEWCLAVPPRCSRWITEMRDVTRLETEERSAEVSVCCPGFKITGNVCVPKCPPGKKGSLCDDECDSSQWGPSCANKCVCPKNSKCSAIDGTCECHNDWTGINCDQSVVPTSTTEGVKIFFNITNFEYDGKNDLFTKTNDSSMGLLDENNQKENRINDSSTVNPFLNKDLSNDFKVTIKELVIEENNNLGITSLTVDDNTSITPNTTLYTTTEISVPRLIIPDLEDTVIPLSSTEKTKNVVPSKTTMNVSVPEIKTTTKGEVLFQTKIDKQYEHIISKSKVTTPKTIIVSIIPTLSNYPLQRNWSNSVNNSKYENKKKNGTIVTTSPIWHIFRLPSQDKYSTIFYKNRTKAPYYYNVTSKTLFTTAGPNTSFTFYSNSTPLTSIYSSNIRVSNDSIYKRVNSKRSDHIFLENALKTYALLRDQLKTNNEKPKKENRSDSDATHLQSVIKSLNSYSKPLVNNLNEHGSKFPEKSSQKTNFNQSEQINTNLKLTSAINTTFAYSSTPSLVDNSYSTESILRKNEDDVLHILTEPEQITAKAEDSVSHSNTDLLSVIIIVGGITLTFISLAILIVMIDQCKTKEEPKQQMKEINQIHFSNKIFHTPLPAPPTENEHYQPIENLSKDLKQFMRPVTIDKPITSKMLEDFRDIFESHYDHLPSRKHLPCVTTKDKSLSSHYSMLIPLSTGESSKTTSIRNSSCEKINKIPEEEGSLNYYNNIEDDNGNDEPVYDEIPTWKSDFQDDCTTINSNGEAVTEL